MADVLRKKLNADVLVKKVLRLKMLDYMSDLMEDA